MTSLTHSNTCQVSIKCHKFRCLDYKGALSFFFQELTFCDSVNCDNNIAIQDRKALWEHLYTRGCISGSKKGKKCHKISLEELMPKFSLKKRIKVRWGWRKVTQGLPNREHMNKERNSMVDPWSYMSALLLEYSLRVTEQ